MKRKQRSRNAIARQLRDGEFAQRIVPPRKIYDRNKLEDIDVYDFEEDELGLNQSDWTEDE